MDESWRRRMGLNLPRRRSTEETSSDSMRRSFLGLNKSSESEILGPNDFNDVFGGPPQSIFSRQLTGVFADGNRSGSFYEEIFRSSDFTGPAINSGNLPAFRIPATRGVNCGGGVFRRNEGFYDDIFGADEDRRSRSRSRSQSKPNSKSKSKSNSSSVLSSEDLSPLRPSFAEDVFSSFSSKLRPINVSCQWNSSRMPEEQQKRHGMSTVPCSGLSNKEFQFMENDFNENCRSSHFGFSQRVPSPETISLEPNSYQSIKISVDDLETDSPTSVVSSLCRDPEAKARTQEEVLQQQEVEQEEDDIMSSYVIEITSDQREGNDDAVDIEEAIAWAKETFQTQRSEDLESGSQRQNARQQREPFVEKEERPTVRECLDQQTDGHRIMQFLEHNEEPKIKTIEEQQQQLEKDMEMEQLEEDIRLWSAGKEANIRLLLSTLHHVLWPNSGWCAIPLVNLIETSQVKKAYQKARLCLHPDKLQQRGATLSQNYVAGNAFAILQDAWAAFISQDVFFG